MVCGGGGIFSLSFESDLPINLLQFLELHKVAVDIALFERIIIHKGRETNLKRYKGILCMKCNLFFSKLNFMVLQKLIWVCLPLGSKSEQVILW